MDLLNSLQDSIKTWLIRLLIFEGTILLVVHVLCMFCYYGLASFLIVISAMLLLFIAMRPTMVGAIFFADLAVTGAQRLFWGRRDNGLELLDQYVRLAKLAITLHCAILLRVIMSPIMSGFTEHIPPFAIAAYGGYAVNRMLDEGFDESVKKFLLTTSVMAFAYFAFSLFPPDTKVGFTFRYMLLKDCPCDSADMKFGGPADFNPACMFNPYSGEAKIVIGQDSKIIDPLYRAPVQCRPRGVPDKGFDYQTKSMCYSGLSRLNADGPERLVPITGEDWLAMNLYYQIF